MSKTLFRALAVLGIVAACAASAPASIIITPQDTSYDGNARDTDLNGLGDVITSTTMVVGDFENANNTTNEIQRGVIIFALPDLPAGQVVGAAELRLYLNSIAGTPAGDAVAYHLRDDNNPGGAGVAAGDFQASPATSIGSVVTPTSAAGTYTIAVTNAIADDYAHDPAASRYATFRLQIDGLSTVNGNEAADRYLFFDMDPNKATNGDRVAQLTITTIPAPEPAGLSLLLIGGWAALGRRRRSSTRRLARK